jgi:hypothetical protein
MATKKPEDKRLKALNKLNTNILNLIKKEDVLSMQEVLTVLNDVYGTVDTKRELMAGRAMDNVESHIPAGKVMKA